MDKESLKNQRHESNSFSSLSDITNDTVSKSDEPLKSAAKEQTQLVSVRSTQPSTTSNVNSLSSQGSETKSSKNEEEPAENTTDSQTMESPLSRPSSNTKVISLPGNRPDLSSGVWIVRHLGQIAAYILPSEEAEEWLGDLLEVNHELTRVGVPLWKINAIALLRIAQLCWAAYQVGWSDFINTDWSDRD